MAREEKGLPCDGFSLRESKMEKREWRFLAIGSVMIFCLVLLSCIPFAKQAKSRTGQETHGTQTEGALREETKETGTGTEAETEKSSETETADRLDSSGFEEEVTKARETEELAIEQKEKYYIKLPKENIKKGAEVYLQEYSMTSQIVFNIETRGKSKSTYDFSKVIRTFQGKSYTGKLKAEELLKSVETKQIQGKEKTRLKIIFTFQKIMEPVLYETESAYYVTLAEPRKVYDKIVVIDAGHGGMDEGTSSLDKKYEEKTYSLMIVKKLKKKLGTLFKDKSVKVYYTRMADMNLSKADRVALANKLHADIFISVHCNASETGEHYIHGLETLYANVPLQYGSLTSKKLAQIMLDELADATSLEKRGIIDREGLYILRNSRVPATIVETGYMTNSEDMDFMQSEKGADLIVKGLYKGILKALKYK